MLKYPLRTYIDHASILLKREVFGKAQLSDMMFYITTRCNARCRMCKIWELEHQDLSPEIIEKAIFSKSVCSSTRIGIEGGELFLHPRYRDIFTLLNKSRKIWSIISNGFLTDVLVENVKEFGIRQVSISLDGKPDTFEEMRGVNQGYSKVLKSINALKGITEVSILFLATPWNTLEDYYHVRNLSESMGLPHYTGYYVPDGGFSNIDTPVKIDPSDIVSYDINTSDFNSLYRKWITGGLTLPCLSIRQMTAIKPNGDILFCQGFGHVIGNIYNDDFDSIWMSRNVRELHKNYTNCNGCWSAYHRTYDIHFFKTLSKIVPLWLINKMFGKLTW